MAMEKAQEAGGAGNAVDYVEDDGGNKTPAETQHDAIGSASSASRNGTTCCCRQNWEERRPRVSPTGTLDASDPQVCSSRPVYHLTTPSERGCCRLVHMLCIGCPPGGYEMCVRLLFHIMQRIFRISIHLLVQQ